MEAQQAKGCTCGGTSGQTLLSTMVHEEEKSVARMNLHAGVPLGPA